MSKYVEILNETKEKVDGDATILRGDGTSPGLTELGASSHKGETSPTTLKNHYV